MAMQILRRKSTIKNKNKNKKTAKTSYPNISSLRVCFPFFYCVPVPSKIDAC